MKKVIFLVMFLLLVPLIKSLAQDDPFENIIKAIGESDARSLSASFNKTVELSFPDNENSYSAAQGEMIMKDFFKKYPPESFDLTQKGTTDPVSQFAICDYRSEKLQFQVYINMRKDKEQYLIHKIKFEEKK
jgi:hypothetical protein